MNRPAAALVLVTALAFGGCASPRNPWVYGISREAYADVGDEAGTWLSISGVCDPHDLLYIPVILAVPFVLDTVFLPVTIPRDCLAKR